MNKKITFEFDNEKAAEYFLQWLCNHGEQDYWDAMSYVEMDTDDDNITVTKFDYWGGTSKGSEFGKHNIICKSGRMDNEEK